MSRARYRQLHLNDSQKWHIRPKGQSWLHREGNLLPKVVRSLKHRSPCRRGSQVSRGIPLKESEVRLGFENLILLQFLELGKYAGVPCPRVMQV